MKYIYSLFIFLSLLGLSLPASAAIDAWLDHDQIAPGETVQLMLQHNGKTDTQPDLSPLQKDFEIVARSSGSHIQIINGSMSTQLQISLTLVPKRSGKLHIPALQWDGQSSLFLPLTVGSSSAATQQGSSSTSTPSHVFLTATLDESQPYVQAAVILKVQIFADQKLFKASLDLPSNKDVLIQQLGKDSQHNETLHGRDYLVIERKYLLFPQHSGQAQFDGPVLNAQVQDDKDPFSSAFGSNPFAGMMSTTRQIRLHGDPIELNVRPRPVSAAAHDWLPARKVTLEESWQPDSTSIRAGDPLTRQLHLRVEGQTAAQLPDLSKLIKLPNGLRAYPDQVQLSNSAQSDAIIGTRDQNIAIVASVAGHYEIPALHLFWWDSTNNSQQEISLPAHAFDVLPSAGGIAVATTPSSPTPPSGNSFLPPSGGNSNPQHFWKLISLSFGLLWLLTVLAWWVSHRRKVKPIRLSQATHQTGIPSNVGNARKALQQACKENDPQLARRHLLGWARLVWPQDPPSGLNVLAVRLDNPEFRQIFNQLDRACYANGEWRGEALMQSIEKLPVKKPQMPTTMQLAPLYP